MRVWLMAATTGAVRAQITMLTTYQKLFANKSLQLTGSGHVVTFRRGISEKQNEKSEFSPNLKMLSFFLFFKVGSSAFQVLFVSS